MKVSHLLLPAALLATSFPACVRGPQTMDQFDRQHERSAHRGDAHYRHSERALERAQARDAARVE